MPSPGSEASAPEARGTHQHRDIAESFGVDPERYDRTRPRYPAELIDRIVATSPGDEVLDVGIGTGIVARQLRDAGCRVLGVEPDPRMGGFARRFGFDVEEATFEDWEPAGRSFDAVVAGQTWHWVDPDAGAVKAAEVLRPGGLLAIFWNAADPPAPVTEAFVSAFRRVQPESPFDLGGIQRSAADLYTAGAQKVSDAVRRTGSFGEPELWRFEWQHTYTRDQWLDQLPTQGVLTRVPAELQAEVMDAVGAAIDELGGSFVMQFTTIGSAAIRNAGR